MEHFILAARAEGLGTCWICAFNHAEMDAVMRLSGTEKSVVAITPVGYAKEEKASDQRPKRKPLPAIFAERNLSDCRLPFAFLSYASTFPCVFFNSVACYFFGRL